MGIVYRAYDRERAEPVALKLLKHSNAISLYRFKREFRALADVVHPNLVPLYELASAGEHWFFTMQLVDGVDFLHFVRALPNHTADELSAATAAETGALATATGALGTGASGVATKSMTHSTADTRQIPSSSSAGSNARLSPDSGAVRATRAGVRAPPLSSEAEFLRLRRALSQLAVGIHELHVHGTLHRDIKPSNVLVDREGRVVLLDFGVVLGLAGQHSALDPASKHVGTPAYMAPEVGAAQSLSDASDWYGVGVMLYEALTGTLPYSGKWRALLELKRTTDPPPPRTLSPHVPADLDELCRQLLQRAPRERATGQDVLRVCGDAGNRSWPTAEPSGRSAAALVGRDQQLRRMLQALDAARDGVPSAVLVHGASGIGKTALVQHFCDEVSAHGALVLSGRCFERESVPYKTLDSLMDCLANTLLELPDDVVDRVLPRDVLALARLFPILRRVEAVLSRTPRAPEVADPHEQRRVAVAALRELLTGLSARTAVVVHIEDLQWGDTDGTALLADVLRLPSPPPVLFIASYRDETEQVGPFIEKLKASMPRWEDIPVGRLSHGQSRLLASSLLDSAGAPASFADAIATEASGSPFFVTELARYVASRSELNSGALSLENLLQTRLAGLSRAARVLLDVIAVAGRPIRQGVALRASDVVEDSRAAIAELRHAHLIRTSGVRDDDLVEAYHDRIRETAYAVLETQARQRCHWRLANSLEATRTADPQEVGVHFEQGGEPRRAGAFYVEAAASAARQLAFDRSGQLYLRAIELLDPQGAERSELFARAGDAYSNAGRGADAARAYRAAAQDAQRAGALRYRGRACEELLRSGHVSDGVTSMREVLTEVGLELPRGRTRSLLSVAWLRARIRMRGLGYRERDASEITLQDLTRIEVCWAAGMALGMSDHMLGTALQARHLLDAMRSGHRDHVTRALALEAVFSSLGGGKSKRRTDKIGVKVLSLAEELGDPLTNVWAKGSRAFCLYQRGEWPEALEFGKAALEHVRGQAGMWWERTSVSLYVLWCQYWLGQVRELAKSVPDLLRDADTRGDLYSYTNFCLGFPAVAWLVRDEPDAWAELARSAMDRWSRDAYHLQHYWYMVAQCHQHLYVGDPRAALDLIVGEWPLLETNMMLAVEMVRIECLHLRGRCALAVARHDAANRTALVRSAERDARALERMRRAHSTALAAMLRAGVSAVDDRPDLAERLRSAEALASTASMALSAAIIRRSLGRVVGGGDGQDLESSARIHLDDQRIADHSRFCRTFLPGLDD